MISTPCCQSLSNPKTFLAWSFYTLLCCVLLLTFAGFTVADEPSAEAKQPPATDQAGEAQGESDPAEKEETKKEKKTQTVTVAEKRLVLTFPSRWKQKERTNNIIEAEFAVPGADAEEESGQANEETPVGRLTLSSSSGSVEQNMRRWVGQFRLGHDADGKDAIRQEEIDIKGAKVHLLDIAGTYFDAPRGPLGPKVERSDYRMLGAIVELKSGGLYFVKFYGPKEVVEANAKDFRKAIDTMEIRGANASAEDKQKADSARTPATVPQGDGRSE